MASFQEFQTQFFEMFNSANFYEDKSYLIVDTKIILPILIALGFQSGDTAKNITTSGKDKTRPDFQVQLGAGNIRCFLVEDKQ